MKKNILTIRFTDEPPIFMDPVFSLIADEKSVAIDELEKMTKQKCNILYIDILDKNKRGNVIITIGSYDYYCYIDWNMLYTFTNEETERNVEL